MLDFDSSRYCASRCIASRFSLLSVFRSLQFEALRRQSSHFRETAKHGTHRSSNSSLHQKFFAIPCTSNMVNNKAYIAVSTKRSPDFNNFYLKFIVKMTKCEFSQDQHLSYSKHFRFFFCVKILFWELLQ